MPRARFVLLALVCLLAAGTAGAVPVPGLFDTGLNAAGGLLSPGEVDAHYTLIASADPSYPGPNAVACSPIPAGYWIVNTAGSRWIAPATDENWPSLGTPHPQGTYTYRLSFDLAGIDPSTVSITGTAGCDNSGAIKLNGVTSVGSIPSYNPLSVFTVNSGFVAGTNHLDFLVTNFAAGGSNPTGLRVQGITGTGNTTVGVEDALAPRSIELMTPSPNPARVTTRIAFSLPTAAHVRLQVRDLAGRTVRSLADDDFAAGRRELSWDGRTDTGAAVRAGVYFVELDSGGTTRSRRMVWMN